MDTNVGVIVGVAVPSLVVRSPQRDLQEAQEARRQGKTHTMAIMMTLKRTIEPKVAPRIIPSAALEGRERE